MSQENTELELARATLARLEKEAAEASAAKLAAIQKQIDDAKAARELQAKQEREAYEARVREIEEKRKREADAKAEAERLKKIEEMRLQAEADKLEQEHKKRKAQEQELARLTQLAHELEVQKNRELAEAQALLDASPEVAAQKALEAKPVTVQDSRHPLSFLFRGQEASIVPPPAVAPVVVPETPLTRRNVTGEDLNITTAAWRAAMGQNGPASGEVFELLQWFDSRAVLQAIKSMAFEWQRNGTQPLYQVEQVTTRLKHSHTQVQNTST